MYQTKYKVPSVPITNVATVNIPLVSISILEGNTSPCSISAACQSLNLDVATIHRIIIFAEMIEYMAEIKTNIAFVIRGAAKKVRVSNNF